METLYCRLAALRQLPACSSLSDLAQGLTVLHCLQDIARKDVWEEGGGSLHDCRATTKYGHCMA